MRSQFQQLASISLAIHSFTAGPLRCLVCKTMSTRKLQRHVCALISLRSPFQR